MVEEILSFVMALLAFTVYLLIIYLSTLSWYEREEEESIRRGLKLGVLLGLVFSILAIIMSKLSHELLFIFSNLILVSFVLSIIVLYPLITWIRKRIYYYFYLASYLTYNVLSWYVFSMFLFFVMGFDPQTSVVASYLIGAIIGTLLATAIIKEIRPREIVFGGLSGVVTAISIADFGTKLLSRLLPPVSVMGFHFNWISFMLIGSLILQVFYYKFIIGR